MMKLSSVEEQVWDYLCSDQPDAERRVRSLVVEAEILDDGSAAAASALGYLWYLVPDESIEREKKGRQWLELALERDFEEPLARLYLAHFDFDSERYEEAIGHLVLLARDSFQKHGQAWRDLKIKELMLAANLELGVLDEIGLTRFMTAYESLGEDERLHPSELQAAVTRAIERNDTRPALRSARAWLSGLESQL